MLVCLLHVFLAGGTAPAIDAPVASDRIESIAMDVAVPGGTMVTRAIALDGGRRTFVFGGRVCREHRVEPIVLEQMFDAMRARHGVRVTGKVVGTVECLATITFFGPDA